MRVKRTTYATRAGVDEKAKLSLEVKQVIKQLQDDLKKKDIVLDKYAKMIQSLKREYQTVSTEKNKLKDFLRKQEEDRKREEQELLRKQHAKQIDIYSRMIVAQKKDKALKEGSIMKVIAAIMMEKALKITTAVTNNEKRDPPKKLT